MEREEDRRRKRAKGEGREVGRARVRRKRWAEERGGGIERERRRVGGE